MQDNSFDKSMEQELHELNIEPSQKVWQAVEKELDKKKRRYFFGWWWLMPLLLAGTGLVGYFNNDETKEPVLQNKNNIIAQTTQAETNTTGPVALDHSVSNNPTTTGIVNDTGNNNASAGKKQQFSPSSTKIKITTAGAAGDVGDHSIKRSSKAKQKITIAAAGAQEEIEENFSSVTMTDEKPSTDKTTVKETFKEEAPATTLKQEIKELKKAEIKDSLALTTIDNKKKKNSRWNKEWVAAAGLADLTSLNFSKQSFESMTADLNGVGSTPGVPDPVRELNEYKFKSGSYLHAGFNIGRSISKKISWSVGLHYNLHAINVDRKIILIDSTFAASPIQTEKFRESLVIHNINIPLLVNFSLGEKIAISTGLYNNFSFSSNWNRYESVIGKQKKYQPVFHLSPSYRIKDFSVGPMLNIGLRQYDFNQRLLNYGLQLKYIPKK